MAAPAASRQGRMGRGWEIAKSSWRILAAHRALLTVSVAATVVAFAVGAAIIGAGYLWLRPEVDFAAADGPPNGVMWLFYGAAGLVGALVTILAQGAVIVAASQRMEGREPDLRSAFAVVRARFGALFAWALLDTAVAGALERLRQRLPFLGNRLAFLGQLAFQVVSFLALPVIIFERTGALHGLKRSTKLLRDTWGENLVFNFALTAVGLLAMVPAIALVLLARATGPDLLFLTLAVAWFVLVAGVTSALSAVYKTALYRWATNQPVDPQFARSDLEGAFGTQADQESG